MPKVSLNSEYNATTKTMVQKGPATDYSMLLQMKRRSILVTEATNRPAGRKATGAIVDNMKTRGHTDSGVIPVYAARGALLGFFKF